MRWRHDLSTASRASRPALLLLDLVRLPAQFLVLLDLAAALSRHQVSTLRVDRQEAFRSRPPADHRLDGRPNNCPPVSSDPQNFAGNQLARRIATRSRFDRSILTMSERMPSFA